MSISQLIDLIGVLQGNRHVDVGMEMNPRQLLARIPLSTRQHPWQCYNPGSVKVRGGKKMAAKRRREDGDGDGDGDDWVWPKSRLDTEGFRLSIDMAYFRAEDVSVKIRDRTIVVQAKQEEDDDDRGYTSCQYVRRYELPEEYDPDAVVSTLNCDGILTISVAKPQQVSKERTVAIENESDNNEKPKDKEKPYVPAVPYCPSSPIYSCK